MLVGVSPNYSLTDIIEINDGSLLDLNNYDFEHVNVTAETDDILGTGSVKFTLTGASYSIDRVENTYEYTMENISTNIDIQDGGWPTGEYLLEITPFSDANALGEEGETKSLRFDVIEISAPDPVAEDDTYETVQNTELNLPSAAGLGANDTYVESSSSFTVDVEPSYGTLNLAQDGGFSYIPNTDFLGSDSFTYRINQDGQLATATVTIEVSSAPEPEPEPNLEPTEGFTAIEASTDSQIIYVSSSDGVSGNDCLSPQKPCVTIASGLQKMRPGFPDHVYLKRGDVWRGANLRELESGRSAEEPSVLAFYGDSGARPKLETTDELYREAALENVHIIGIEFSAYKMQPSHPEFSGASGDRGSLFFLGGTENILIEDCLFNFVELLFQGWDGENSVNVSVRRNMFTGSYYNSSSFNRNSRPSNMFMDSVEGALIEENVFDYGGWYPGISGAASNMFNHNVYIQYTSVGNKIIFRNNIVTRGASHGVHGRPGGLYEDNFFARNAVGLQMGYWNQPLDANTFAIARNNVVIEGESIAKGDQACTGANLCTPALWGVHIDELGDGDFQLIGNIAHSLSENDEWTQVFTGLVRTGIRFNALATYDSNISWHWDSDTDGDAVSYVDPGRTLEDYHASIGAVPTFDAFMDIVKSRSIQSWDERYSAKAVNAYIRAGFELQ